MAWLPTCSSRRRDSSFRWGPSIPATPPRSATPRSPATTLSSGRLDLLGAGSTAVVIGAGGLGQMAIQVLRALSAAVTIVAVDTTADKLEIAKRMGADETLLSGDEAVTRIKDITHGQGAELVLDMVGVNADAPDGRAGRPGARPPDDRGARWRSRFPSISLARRRSARSRRPTGAPSPS